MIHDDRNLTIYCSPAPLLLTWSCSTGGENHGPELAMVSALCHQVRFHPRWRGDHSVPAQRVQLDWTIAGSISNQVGRHILSHRSSAAEQGRAFVIQHRVLFVLSKSQRNKGFKMNRKNSMRTRSTQVKPQLESVYIEQVHRPTRFYHL
ncbi:hypothetical protein XPA_002955 [Xanthoria parietina]